MFLKFDFSNHAVPTRPNAYPYESNEEVFPCSVEAWIGKILALLVANENVYSPTVNTLAPVPWPLNQNQRPNPESLEQELSLRHHDFEWECPCGKHHQQLCGTESSRYVRQDTLTTVVYDRRA